jgi:uncharacterized protein YjbI with pentapeptide repeats
MKSPGWEGNFREILFHALQWIGRESALRSLPIHYGRRYTVPDATQWRNSLTLNQGNLRYMANKAHLEILLQQGAEAWNSWRVGNPSIEPDLTGASLTGASLYRANLSGTYLTGANLTGAYLSEAKLYRAKLTGAILSEADLRTANLGGAKLTGAILSGAKLTRTYLKGADLGTAILGKVDLSGADLSGANLTGAYLSGAILTGAVLYRAKLAEAKLTGADLSNARLSGAYLYRAKLSEAKLPNARLTGAYLSGAILSGADLSGADLRYCTLASTNLENATLEGCRIYGISAWSLKLKGANQWNLNISAENEPAVIVDNLEVAQFIYLLLNHKKLRDVLNAVTERGVLILGRFDGGGLEVLEAIAAKLRELDYQPFIFDFDRQEDRNYTETVKTLVGLSRFVIVDLSGPSVPQELYATVPHFKIPFVPIIEEGRRQSSMVDDILEYPWVLDPPVRYVDVKHLLRAMPTQVIALAERRVKDRRERLADRFGA